MSSTDSTLKRFGKATAAGAATALGMYGAHRGISAFNRAALEGNRDQHITEMIAEHPQLASLPRDVLLKAYRALLDYAPEFVDDPYVGGEILLALATKNTRLSSLKDARALAGSVGHSYERDLADTLARHAVEGAVSSTMKTSSYQPPSMLSTLAAPAIGALTAAGVAYAVPAAVEAVQNMKIRANRDKYLAEMKKVHPDMRSISDTDLHIAYNSIAQHTPDVLTDPLLGGQTLKQMAQFRMANVQALNEISRLRGQRPLDVALQTSTQFLAQGAADVAKTYTQQRVEDARNRFQQARVDQAAADATYRKDRDEALDKQFEQNIGLREKEQKYRETRDTLLDTRYGQEQEYLKDRDKVRDKQFGLTHGQRVGEQRYRVARDKVLDTRYGQEQVVDNARYEDTYALNAARMDMDRARADAQHQMSVLNLQLGANNALQNTFTDATYDRAGQLVSYREPDQNPTFSTRSRLSNLLGAAPTVAWPATPPRKQP